MLFVLSYSPQIIPGFRKFHGHPWLSMAIHGSRAPTWTLRQVHPGHSKEVPAWREPKYVLLSWEKWEKHIIYIYYFICILYIYIILKKYTWLLYFIIDGKYINTSYSRIREIHDDSSFYLVHFISGISKIFIQHHPNHAFMVWGQKPG